MPETSSYGYTTLPASRKRRLVRDHFEAIARRYDLADTLLSFGLHILWRRRALRRLKLQPGETVLDLCSGTGDFAILAARAVGKGGRVLAADFSGAMMRVGRTKAARAGVAGRLSWVRTDAEQMGLARDGFDAVLVGYGIRNFVSLEEGLREILRVLKPGGRFLAMEFSIPETAWIRGLYHLYSFRVMPPAGRLICGTAAPFQYLAESVRVFPEPDRIRFQLTELGFEGAGFERLHNGLAVLYSGTKAD
ncbi:MAG: ubiquinone/menaquinone biosynthesis methyltransferase [Desulfohalobiaceae bacterium]|nr:ubiquinone/menaquinone biosynthesis methyltransferase [Desulfohalobiaceae bacterium]